MLVSTTLLCVFVPMYLVGFLWDLPRGALESERSKSTFSPGCPLYR